MVKQPQAKKPGTVSVTALGPIHFGEEVDGKLVITAYAEGETFEVADSKQAQRPFDCGAVLMTTEGSP